MSESKPETTDGAHIAADCFALKQSRITGDQRGDRPNTTEDQVVRAAKLIKARAGLRSFLNQCEAARVDSFELAVLHSRGEIISTNVKIPRDWITWAVVALIDKAQTELDEMGVCK